MHGSESMTADIPLGLGCYFLLVVLLNVGFVAYQLYGRHNGLMALVWGAVAAVFLVHAVVFFAQARAIARAANNCTSRPGDKASAILANWRA